MPTYSYRCPSCGHDYTKFQKITDKTRAKCPECGARGERIITGGGGLIFKGSGFYVTDYKRAGEKKGETPEAGTAKKSEAKPDSATKPETKSKTGSDA